MTPFAPSRPTAKQLLSLPVVAVDFETYYSSEYSVSDSSYWHYTHDSRFRAYLVSIVGPDFEFVGDPKDFDWSRIDGMLWISHNRSFDRAVYDRLCELGVVKMITREVATGVVCESNGAVEYMDECYEPGPAYWGDTAPLSVFMRAPRNLAGAAKVLLGVTRSKEIRNVQMKGKQWEEYGDELQAKIKLYALDDSRDCRNIWVQNGERWPDTERWIADMLAERGQNGFAVDRPALDADITFMEQVKFEAEQKIPWTGDASVLSPKALRAECTKCGIPAPASLSLTDEECAAWEDEFADTYPWIAAVRTWRRGNTILSKLKAIRDRIRDTDNRMEFQLAYHAAHTGRSGGTGGYNMLNQARAPFYINRDWNILHRKSELMAIESYRKKNAGALPDSILRAVDFRSKLTASPGNKLVIGDKAQIEARVTRWVAGDKKTLRLIEEGFNPYEAHAMNFMNFTGTNMKKNDPAGYQLAKARELSLGFLVGWHKFITMAKNYVDDVYFAKIFGAEVGDELRGQFIEYINGLRNAQKRGEYLRMWERADAFTRNCFVNSWIQVTDFRAKNPEIMTLANRLKNEMERSVGENYSVVLPSGREMTYFNVTKNGDGLQARVERGGPLYFFHGGLLIENVVQATARDVFVEDQLRAEAAGLNVVLDVYDELVCDEPRSRDKQDLLDVMRARPSWAKTLPIDAEVDESLVYCK